MTKQDIKLNDAKFCKHGLGVAYLCAQCGEKREGVHKVPWDQKQQAYVWPLPNSRR